MPPLGSCPPAMLRAWAPAEAPTEGAVGLAALHSNSAASTFISCSSFRSSSCLKRAPANAHTFRQLDTIPSREGEMLCWSPHQRPLLHHFVLRDALPRFAQLQLLICRFIPKAKSAQSFLRRSRVWVGLQAPTCPDQAFGTAPERWLWQGTRALPSRALTFVSQSKRCSQRL